MVRDPSIVSPTLTGVFTGGGHNKHGAGSRCTLPRQCRPPSPRRRWRCDRSSYKRSLFSRIRDSQMHYLTGPETTTRQHPVTVSDLSPLALCRPRRLGGALLALRVGGYRVPVQGQGRSAGFHLVCCLDLVLLAGTERVSNRAGGRHLHYAGLYGEEEPGGAGLLLLQAGAHRPHRRGHGGVQHLAVSVSSSTKETSRSIHPRWTLCGDSGSVCVTHLGS